MIKSPNSLLSSSVKRTEFLERDQKCMYEYEPVIIKL
jgi:hypothetical protein